MLRNQSGFSGDVTMEITVNDLVSGDESVISRELTIR
jgi:hypothetical protein